MCSSRCSLRKCPVVTETMTENHNSSGQSCIAQSQWTHVYTTQAPEAQRSSKGAERLWEPEGQKVYCQSVFPGNVHSYTHKPPHDFLSMTWTRSGRDTLTWKGERSWGLNSKKNKKQKNPKLQPLRNVSCGRKTLPQEEDTYQLANAKWSSLKTYTQAAWYRLTRLDLHMYLYTYICLQEVKWPCHH